MLLEISGYSTPRFHRKLSPSTAQLLTWLLTTWPEYTQDQNLDSVSLEPESQESILRTEGKLNKSLFPCSNSSLWKPTCHPRSRAQFLSFNYEIRVLMLGNMLFPFRKFCIIFIFLKQLLISYFLLCFYLANVIFCQCEASLSPKEKYFSWIFSMNSKIMLEKLLKWTSLQRYCIGF